MFGRLKSRGFIVGRCFVILPLKLICRDQQKSCSVTWALVVCPPLCTSCGTDRFVCVHMRVWLGVGSLVFVCWVMLFCSFWSVCVMVSVFFSTFPTNKHANTHLVSRPPSDAEAEPSDVETVVADNSPNLTLELISVHFLFLWSRLNKCSGMMGNSCLLTNFSLRTALHSS